MDNLFDKITFESRNGEDPSTYKVWDSGAARIISEFIMAERRQNLMSGDGYNTIYAKLSRWYEDFKPIVWSGSYNDLENKPVIPVVNDGILEIKRNGVSIQTFSANSNMSVVADIEVPIIDDNNSSATTLYSSQRIDALIRELGPNIIDGGGQEITIDSETIDQIAQQVINSITIPTATVDYNVIYQYIDEHTPEVNNGKLNVKINGVAALSQNGNILPALSNYFSANQSEDYDLNITIPEPTEIIDNNSIANNTTWSSEKIRNEILASGSLRMVVLGDGVSHTSIQGEANTIYFEKITNSDLENQYSEWVWTGDTWENIGRQIIDLSAYALKSEIGNATIRIVQMVNNTLTELGSFTTNEQSSGTPHDITIPTPIIGNGTITIIMGKELVNGVEQDKVIGTFSVNQIGNTTITIPEPEPQVQSDWNEADTTSPAFILNKPTIPVVNNGTLTITVGGVTYTFTANQADNQTINIPAQEQADWNQTNTTAPDYIKNKPTIVKPDWDAQADSNSEILNKPNLAAVATSGDYNDLQNTPTIPAAQVNSDWNSDSGVSQILNKPILGTAAALDVPLSGDASTSQVVKGDDSRLTDARTPVSHTHTISEITDFPTIPDAQIQADWNQSDSTAKDYIKNKPTISNPITTITASSISNSLDNLSTSGLSVNDIVIVANIGSTFTYTTSNYSKTINGPLDFDLMFRWTGSEFRPMFYSVH